MTISLVTPNGTAPTQTSASNGSSLWGSDGFGFGDLIDIVNPLQHLPVVGNIYRSITGDQIGSLANVVGSTIFGGPVGGGMALAGEVVKGASGKSVGEHAMSAISGQEVQGDLVNSRQTALTANQATNAYEKASDISANNEPRTYTKSNINGGSDSGIARKSTTHSWIYGGTHLA